MQFSRKGKKENQNENVSRIEDANASVHSGINMEQYRRGQDTRRRQGNNPSKGGEEYEKSTTESGYKEILFLDPSDNYRRHPNMSPTTEGRQNIGTHYMQNRSPGQPVRQSVISSVRNDLNERQDTAQMVGKKPISQLTVSIPFRKEDVEAFDKNERSPKVINLAGGLGDPDYNTKSLQFRRSPGETQKINYQPLMHTISPLENYTGNLLLDQPVLGSFNQGNEQMNHYNPNYNNHTMKTGNIHGNDFYKSGEIQVNMRDPRERDREINFNDKNINHSQDLKSKMSPNRNVEEREIFLDKNNGIDSNRKNDKIQDLKRLTKLIEKPNEIDTYDNDHLQRSPGTYDQPFENYYRNYGSDIENLIKMKQVRKFNRKATSGFNPQKKEGQLFAGGTHVINPMNDQLFPDRKTVLSKMNKLSHILMSKSRSLEPMNRSLNGNDDLNSSTYNRQTLRQSQDDNLRLSSLEGRKTYALSRSPQQKFIRITMAMLSSKGPNCEDRIITRVMRFEKGGVVDLAQNQQKNKKYEVKKIRRTGEKGSHVPARRFNPKDRERASKIVQAWWREVLNKYKNLMGKILKIQSVWRGHWLRTYLYEIIYSGVIVQNFIDRLKAPLVRHVSKPVFEKMLDLVPEITAKNDLYLILKLQKNLRLFLMRLRNKIFKLPLRLQKIVERKRKNTMDILKAHSMNADMRAKKRNDNLMNLLNKIKKAMRVRIFHDLLFKIFNRPINQLKSAIFRNMLKNNINKFTKILLKEWFNKWKKKSLKSTNTLELKNNAAQQMYRTIMRYRLNDLTSRLRKLPPKGLKSKILKRLVKNADRYSDVFLRECFFKWHDTVKRLRILEFKNQLLGRFLLKTSKRLEQNNLKRWFRRWAYQKRPGKDLIPYVDGWDHLNNHVRRRMYNQVMPIDSVKGVKDRLLRGLMKKSDKFKLFPLRHYLNKWKKYCSQCRRNEISGMLIRALGNKYFSKNIHSMLLKKLLDWKRKVEFLKYMDNLRNQNDDKKKYFALVKLMSGTEKLAKRKALKTAYPQIMKYLDSILRQGATKKLLMMNPKLNRILKKNYWNKWMEQVNQCRKKEVRNKFFDTLTSKTGSRVRKNILRKYLTKWFRNLPKNLEIKYYNGAETLQRALWRRNKRKPIDAFKEKIELENAKNGMQRAFGLKNKYIQRHWREYLLKWKKICDKIKLKEVKSDLCGKLFATLLNKFKNRILSMRFSHWKKVPRVNMKDIFDRFKNMINFAQVLVQNKLKPTKKDFLARARNHKGNKAYRNALSTLANMAINGNLLKLRNYFDKWRRQVTNYQIYELKQRLLRASVGQENIKNKKKSLASCFGKWLRNIKLDGLLRHSDKNLIIYKAVNGLNLLFNRRMNDFITRLKRLMNLDTRGRLLLQIYKRLQRPRVTLSRSFDRWRRINDKYNRDTLSKNYITKLMDSTCKKASNRMQRDRFLRCFNKWKNLLRKPEDYYLRIADGTKKANNFLKSKCSGPFNQLTQHKNYKKYFMNMLPAHTRLSQRMNRDSILRCWNKWKKVVSHDRLVDYNVLLLDKLAKKMSQRRKNNALSSAFNKWANIKAKSLHFPHVVRGKNIIQNTLERPWRKLIFDNLYKNWENKTKKNGLMLLFGKSKTFNNHKLRNYLKKWWKNHLLIDENLKSRVMRTMKRVIVENYMMGPLEKYFRRWLKNMIEKPKNVKNFVDGADKLKSGLKKKYLREPLKNMKNYRSPDAMKKALFNKVLPKSKNLMKKYMSNALHQWKKNVDKYKLNDMQLRLLNSLYGKNKRALMRRYLKKYFSRWSHKEEDTPIDLARILSGERVIFRMFANKYLKGFLPEMKQYSISKFLRGCLLKNSKFHQKALEPFFRRWKDNANKLKAKQAESGLVGRLIAKTKIYYYNKNVKDLMRAKLNQWRNYIRDYDNKMRDVVPKANELIKKNVLKKIFPEFVKPMKQIRLKSRRKEKLNDAAEIGLKVLYNHLRNSFGQWKNQIHKLQLRDLRLKTMQAHLTHMPKRLDHERLARCFRFWVGAIRGKSGIRSIIVGADTLRRLFTRKPFSTLKDKTKMWNLKIPNGMSLSECLIRMNPHIAKSVAIRNIGMRPYFKKWLTNAGKLKEIELKQDIFKKLFYPNLRNHGRLVARKAFNRWNDVIAEEDKLEMKKKFQAKILRNIYEHNHSLWLRRMFDHWKDLTKDYYKKLNNISLGLVKLRHMLTKRPLHDLYKRIYVRKDGFTKFQMIRKILMNALRNSDKGNVLYCFSTWKKNNHNLRETILKQKILKNLINKHEQKNEEYDKNNLHEKLLRWRINCAPKDYYDTINRIRLGAHALNQGAKKPFNNALLNGLKAKARKHKLNELLYSFISKYDQKAYNFLIRFRFNHWRVRVGDTDFLTRRLARLCHDYHNNSDLIHKELFKKPLDDLIDCMKAWVALKTKKANTIQDYCKTLMDIFKRMKLVQRNRNLHKIFGNLNLKTAIRSRVMFARWMKNCNLLNVDEKAKKIQNYLRGKQDALTKKRNMVRDGSEHLEKYAKMKTFNDLWLNGKLHRRRQLLLRLMKDLPNEVRLEFLGKYFKRWRADVLRGKEHAASEMITAVLRGFLTRKFMNLLNQRKYRLNEVIKKLWIKYFDKRKLYFNKWLLDNRMFQCNKSGQVINAFLKGRLLNLKEARAKIGLLDKFRKSYIRKLHKAMEKSAKINGDRGLIMYDTIKDIYLQRPFTKVRDGSKWIGRLRKLHHVYPRITRALKNYWLPYYMRKWKERTYDDKMRKIIRLQNWYRTRLLLWRARIQARKAYLITKYASKLTNDNDLKLKLALKNWTKKAVVDALHKKASAVQALWRGNTSRKNANRMLSVKNMHELLKKLLRKRLCDEIVKCADFIHPLKNNLMTMNPNIERRYPTNNMLDLANNAIRNAYMYNLTKKRTYLGEKSLLRDYFNRFKRFAGQAQNAAQKLQNKYRQFLAKKQLKGLLHIKDVLLKLHGKYETTEQGKLKIAFNRWNNKANIMKLNDKAKVIQDYIKVRNARWQNTKFKNFFFNNGLKLVKRRINNAAKTDRLKTTLQKQALRTFLERAHNKKRIDKFLWIFGRRFNNMDDQLKNLYMRKYLEDWNDRAKRLSNKRYASALSIMSLFRGFLARKFVGKLLNRKERLKYLMMRLINDNDSKKAVCFSIWLNKMRSEKLEHSAKVLQKFMSDVKDKNDRIKAQRKLKRISDGLDQLSNTWLKAAPSNAIHKIKSEANRKLLTKVADNVENKKKNHLQTAFDAIKDFGDLKSGVRNKSARLIQNKFNLFKNRKSIWNLIDKIRKLRFLLKLMANRNLRLLNKAVKIWGRNALGDKWHNSAMTIQNFLNERVLRWRNNQKIAAMENLYKLFRNHFVNCQFRPYMKDFVNTLKLQKLKDLLGKHIFKKFRYNIFNYEKLNLLNKLFRLPLRISQKILRKHFNHWHDLAQSMRLNEGARKIQQNFQGFKSGKRKRLIGEKINSIITKLSAKHQDIRRYYLTKWNRRAQHLKNNENALVIQNFVGKHWDRIRAKKLWWNLTNQLFIKNNILSGVDFFRRYKQFRSLSSIFNVLDRKIKRDGLDDLKTKSHLKKIGNLMKLIYVSYEKRNDNLKLWNYWKRWLEKVDHYRKRDAALNNLNDILDTRRKIIAAKAINDASILKKTLQFIDRTRGKYAINKINDRAKNRDKLRNFGDNLKKADEDLNNKNIDLFVNRLYRLYIYKILDNLNKNLNNFKKNVIKPTYGKFFLTRLHDNFIRESKDSYEDERNSNRIPKSKQISFKSSVRNPRKEQLEKMQKQPLKYLAPHMNNFLSVLRKRRFNWAMDSLKNRQRASKYCELLNKYLQKALHDPKEALNDELQKKYQYNIKTPHLLANLFKLFRKRYIRHVSDSLIPFSKLHRLIYLLRVTLMNSDLASGEFLRELIRRWRFIIYMKKLGKQKMELMYKNMHINYLNMTKEMFGDDDSSRGLIKEFELFGNGFGMFTNQDIRKHEERKRQFYKGLTKRYIFEPVDVYTNEEEENRYDDNSIFNRVDRGSIIGDNPEYYYDEAIGEGTQGRYKVDTNVSGKNSQFDEKDYERKKRK